MLSVGDANRCMLSVWLHRVELCLYICLGILSMFSPLTFWFFDLLLCSLFYNINTSSVEDFTGRGNTSLCFSTQL